jgi:hypothetical protein
LLPYRELVSALVVNTLPGDSILGSILRDPTVWTGTPASKVTLHPLLDRDNYSTSPANFVNLTFQIEDHAGRDGSHIVGERHIAQLLVDAKDVQFLGLNAKAAYTKVRELELGPELPERLTSSWDGLIDTNIVLQYKDLWTIDWRAVVNRPDTIFPVTIWASAALLSEIDDQQYYSRNQRVARKARSFARWLKNQVKSASDIEHGIFFDSVRLRFLTVPMEDVSADSRHLEAALALRDRQVNATVITHDTLLRLRAIQAGFAVLDLPDDLLDEKVSGS